MLFTSALAAAPLIAAAAAFTPASTSGTDKLYAQGLVNLAKYELKNNPPSSCSISTGYVRQEWSALSAAQKTAYISAVQCLQSKPSKSGSLAPGAKSRYDDFVAAHINQTLTIHGTVSLYPSVEAKLPGALELTHKTGQLPVVAQVLCLHVRDCTAQRVRLHRPPALPLSLIHI